MMPIVMCLHRQPLYICAVFALVALAALQLAAKGASAADYYLSQKKCASGKEIKTVIDAHLYYIRYL